ncbi:ADP-ribosylglycohydrolase family protein [Maioricimonas rarisocia]|nr:ADP-ribosylglycohydrolase family protein [Maioricimonas rarisocia]
MQHALVGSLLGTAVGDALGLPYEGLSRRRAARLLGDPDRYRLIAGRGMVSDDTEQSCLVLQALVDSRGEPQVFARCLARRLRRWFLMLPAGVGMATARAMLRSMVGYGPDRSGVFSAGNGPAMRSAILGAAIDEFDPLRQLVRVSTRITHTDPKAEQGALAVALAARCARGEAEPDATAFFRLLREQLPGDEAGPFRERLNAIEASLDERQPTVDFAATMRGPKGVSGYVLETVPVALHAWLSHPRDFAGAVTAVIRCGGDTDTTAAITGGIVGAAVGREGIPADWLNRLADWPLTVGWMERLCDDAERSLAGESVSARSLPAWKVLPRNLLFFSVVLAHGFRRLLPPW